MCMRERVRERGREREIVYAPVSVLLLSYLMLLCSSERNIFSPFLLQKSTMDISCVAWPAGAAYCRLSPLLKGQSKQAADLNLGKKKGGGVEFQTVLDVSIFFSLQKVTGHLESVFQLCKGNQLH